MTALVSRILVAAVLLPVVLLLIWAGGWWMIGLAVVAGMVALHELYVMTRNLRPVLLAGYAGTLATLIGAAWGPEWALAGFFSTLPLAFLFKAASGALPSAAFFDEVDQEAADVTADVRARTLEITAPPRSDIFAHVYSEPHPLIDAQAAWLEEYENSFEGDQA